MPKEDSFFASLVAGGCAGTAVDVTLFPIDTVKTRLQSAEGFWKAGGFRGIYSGLGAAAIGSAPGAGLFFATYDTAKKAIMSSPSVSESQAPLVHMVSAGIGETAACLVRVPTENVKQNMQIGGTEASTSGVVRKIMAADGVSGFYRGYLTTVLREIPFAFIQFPLYEKLKSLGAGLRGKPLESWQSACCGSVAGATAGAITNPLDVVKTRLMTQKRVAAGSAEAVKYRGMLHGFQRIAAEEGLSALMSGVTPRVTFISIGGFVFFGTYEGVKRMIL